MKEAMLYERIGGKKVKCNLCSRNCTIPEGKRGFCRVRENREGTLYTLVYDKVEATIPDPIQKKPLFHFAPGTMTFSISTVGCNFRCKFCCNWLSSQSQEITGRSIPPKEIVEMAEKSGCSGLSYTYTEQTIFFELAYETAQMAHKKGLYNTFVTNGYMTKEAIRMMAPYLDAATVDFKGAGDPDFYRKMMDVPDPSPIYENLKEMKRNGIFIEITNLVVPRIGDSEERIRKLSSWIIENLGEKTPFHLLAFFPSYQMNNIPPATSETLTRLADAAEEEGLKFVYVGNVPGHERENTYCPSCGKTVITRWNVYLRKMNVTFDGKCPHCGEELNLGGLKWVKTG